MARNASITRKSKRPSAGHQPGALRQILTNTRLAGLLLLSCLFLATMMGLTIWGDRGLLAMWHKQREVAGLVQEIEAIERENTRLGHKIQHLRKDMRYIETIAREELGLVQPDELVFEFVEKKPR